MYEELISRLKNLAMLTIENGESVILVSDEAVQGIREIATEAADAIEELSREVDMDNDAMTAMDAAMPRWIPVAERLPDKAEQIADHWFSDDVIGKDEVTIRKAYYNFTAGVWFDANCEMEWGSITHWMPMPPKEET